MADQKLVGITNYILSFEHGRAQIQFFITEINQQILKPGIFVLYVSQIAGIEINVAEYPGAIFTGKFTGVGLFQCFQSLVDQFSNIRFVSVVIQIVKASMRRHYKTFSLHRPFRSFFITIVLI